MNYFYLNETLGESKSLEQVAKGMQSIIDGYHQLLNVDGLNIKKGWVIEKEVNKLQLAGYNLQEILQKMDKTYRTLFYSYTTMYPIHRYFKCYSDEELLNKDYKVQGLDATNIAIVAFSNGILMSLPLADWLCVNQIEAVSSKDSQDYIQAHNLYGGQGDNIKYITDVLVNINRQSAVGLGKIKKLSVKVVLENEFEKQFNDSPSEFQNLIIGKFEEAKTKKLILPIKPNGTIVKKVDKHVFELRIVNPVDIRVYFYEKNDNLYIASMALKSKYVGQNDQTNDIVKAEMVLEKYANDSL